MSLPSSLRNVGHEDIRATIRRETNLTASAGVSYNKRMARPVCKSFRVSCLFQSAATYPASRLCPEPRWRFAHPGPHNYLRRRAPFVVSGFRNAVSTVRPSRVHRSQTSSGHRRVALCFADCLRQTNSQIRRRGFHAVKFGPIVARNLREIRLKPTLGGISMKWWSQSLEGKCTCGVLSTAKARFSRFWSSPTATRPRRGCYGNSFDVRASFRRLSSPTN
jgi:hypothetical protein